MTAPPLGFWLTDDQGRLVVTPQDGQWVTLHGAGFLDGRVRISDDWFDRLTRSMGQWLDKNAETVISTGAGVVGFLAGGPVGAGLASSAVMAAFGAMKKAVGQGTTEQERAAAAGLFMSAAEAGAANLDTTGLSLTDMGGGEIGLDAESTQFLVAQGKAKVVDGAANLVAGNPDAPITIVAFGGQPVDEPYQARNLYANAELWDIVSPHIKTAYGSEGAQRLYDELVGGSAPDDSERVAASGVAEPPKVPAPILAAGVLAAGYLVYKIAKERVLG